MQSKLVLCLLGAFFLAAFQPIHAQPPPKIAKIGWLGARGSGTGLQLFKRDFAELGYVEGKNIIFEYRYADNNLERLPKLAEELVRLKVDVIIVNATVTALAAQSATRTIPIVFLTGADPVADGLVESLARPGKNLTGFTTITGVLAGKRLELLKETLPTLNRVGVLWNPKDRSTAQQWKESQLVARHLRLQLHSMEVSSADKFASSFQDAIKAGSTAIAVTQSSLAAANQNQLLELAARNRLPALYPREDFVTLGGLIAYGADRNEPFKRAAVMVDKILKGTKPADIPVERPMNFVFVVNLKTAKALGLTIPPEVLARANRIIR